MTPNLGGWIHTFTVTDTQTHKGGYTIYKITSIVFPRSVPEALTCLVVWKRFHEVKRLYRELRRRHKNLQLPGKVPEPTDASYFRRFDNEVIEKRKKYILELLDFAAQYPALYKCHPFTQFFSDANSLTSSPLHRLHIEHVFPNKINKNEKSPDKLLKTTNDKNDKENDLDFCYISRNGEMSFVEPDSNDKVIAHPDERDHKKCLLESNLEHDVKVLDNVIEVKEQKGGDLPEEEKVKEVKEERTECLKVEQRDDKRLENKENIEEDETKNKVSKDEQTKTKDFMNVLTPMASIESDDSDYIYEAALEFSNAVQAEVNQNYKEAYEGYKQGVDILVNGAKEDSNDERKLIAKTKISKYSARLNEIHERFLKDIEPFDAKSIKKVNFQLSVEDEMEEAGILFLERPWTSLSNYKVVAIINDRVMKVQSLEENDQSFYVMKGIEKPSSNSPTQSIFLPQNVPYMTDLLGYFQSDEKVFLLLRYAEGGLLFDHIKNYCPSSKRQAYEDLFPELTASDESYDVCSPSSVQDSGYAETTSTSEIFNDVEEAEEFSALVKSSQELLQSVSRTLNKVRALEEEKSNEQIKLKEMRPFTKVPEPCLRQWISELALAIQALHAKGIILKDLHMENLLLGSKGQLLLTYFYQNEGPAFEDSYVHKSFNMKAFSDHFVAPERPLNFKSDWWSFGIIVYQLITGVTFKSMHPGNIDLYTCVQYPENAEISIPAQDLIEKLIDQNPEERFDFEQIQKHNFFKGIKWKNLRSLGINKKSSNDDSKLTSQVNNSENNGTFK